MAITTAQILHLGKLQQWRVVTEELERARLMHPPNSVLESAAISAYGSSSQWQRALSTLHYMQRGSLEPNVISYSAAMSACEKGCRWEIAMILLSKMPENQVEPNQFSFGTALSSLAKGEAWEEALALLRELPSRGIEVGLIRHLALELLLAAEVETLQPSLISFSAAISACERGCIVFGRLNLGHLSSLEAVHSAVGKADVICYSAAISACEKGSQWSKALDILHGMPSRHCTPNVISYNAAISACENAEHWEEAINLLESLRRTFNSLVSASPDWHTALGLFSQMLQEDINPTVVSYNALLGSLVFRGSWQQSLQLLEEMMDAEPGRLRMI
eukprot:symbB.v1.2.012951.t1/scaffold892.1/size156909/3